MARYFTKDHEWLDVDGDTATVGITTYAQEQLGDIVFVRPDGIPVVMLQFGAEYAGGDVKPEVGAFTDFAWVNADEVKDYDCIDGIQAEVSRTIRLFS